MTFLQYNTFTFSFARSWLDILLFLFDANTYYLIALLPKSLKIRRIVKMS